MKVNHTTKTKEFYLVGEATSFYIFNFNTDTPSGWINGKANEFFHLRNAFKKSKSSFNALCRKYF